MVRLISYHSYRLFMLVLNILDYISTFVFAFNGTKAYLNHGSCLVRAVLCGILTAVGGGTVRDTLMGVPIFWTKQPLYIFTALSFAVLSLVYYGKISSSNK